MDKESGIHGKINVDNGRKPIGGKKSRVGDDKIGARDQGADLYEARLQLDGRRRNKIADSGHAFFVELFRLVPLHFVLASLAIFFEDGGELYLGFHIMQWN